MLWRTSQGEGERGRSAALWVSVNQIRTVIRMSVDLIGPKHERSEC